MQTAGSDSGEHKGNRRQTVDEEKKMIGHWLESCIVSFSALTMLTGEQQTVIINC